MILLLPSEYNPGPLQTIRFRRKDCSCIVDMKVIVMTAIQLQWRGATKRFSKLGARLPRVEVRFARSLRDVPFQVD